MPGNAHVSIKHTLDGKLSMSGHFSPDSGNRTHHTGKHDDTSISAVDTYRHDLQASQQVKKESILAMIKARPADEKAKIRRAQDRNNEIKRLQSQNTVAVNEPDYAAIMRKRIFEYKKMNGEKWKESHELRAHA